MNKELNLFENSKINAQKDKEMLELIKKVILSHFPIIEDRIDILLRNPAPALDINFNLGEDNNKEMTQIYFLKGTTSFKTKIAEEIIANGYINPSLIIDLISFILKDHDIITTFNYTSNEITLNFNVDLKEQNTKGISCSTISLNLDLTFCPKKEDMINIILKIIWSHFFYKLKNTTAFQEEYQKYCNNLRQEVAQTSTKEELEQLLSLLNKEELTNLLYKIPNGLFLILYDKLKESKKEDIPFERKRIPNKSN